MWWQSLSDFQQIIFIVAGSATLILLVLMILMLIGIGDETFDGSSFDDADFDVYNDEPISAVSGLRILSLRGALAFLSIGGWVAFILEPVLGVLFAIILGIVSGLLAAFLLALAFKASTRLESSGNLDYQNAIGKTATVYLRIPQKKSGIGKVNLILQERFIEAEAMTEDFEDILVKQVVDIVGLENERTLLVRKRKD